MAITVRRGFALLVRSGASSIFFDLHRTFDRQFRPYHLLATANDREDRTRNQHIS